MAAGRDLRSWTALLIAVGLLEVAGFVRLGAGFGAGDCFAGGVRPPTTLGVVQYALTFEEWFEQERHPTRGDWERTLASRIVVTPELGARFTAKVLTGDRRRSVEGRLTPNESGEFVLDLDYKVEHLHIFESNNVQTIITLDPDKRLAMSRVETHETLDGVEQRGTRLTFVVVLTKSSAHASSGTASASVRSRAAKTSPNVAQTRN
jgi:hypothetical protein